MVKNLILTLILVPKYFLPKWQKTSFRAQFGPFGPDLGSKIFFVDFISTRC